jgi:hypothetical protein
VGTDVSENYAATLFRVETFLENDSITSRELYIIQVWVAERLCAGDTFQF